MRSPTETLIVEDDPQIRRFLRASLSAEDYRLHEAVTADEGLAEAQARQPDLVLPDLGLPDQDGLEVIRHVRQSSQTPIIVISARGQEKDKIAALDRGADDFVNKPFAMGELLARIRAAFRIGEIVADLEARVVSVAGREIHLTPVEFRLLQTLSRHAGKVVTQRQLLVEVWGPQNSEQAQYCASM